MGSEMCIRDREKPEGEGSEAAADTEEAPVDLGDGNDMPEDLLDE